MASSADKDKIGVPVVPEVDKRSFAKMRSQFTAMKETLRTTVPVEYRTDAASLARVKAEQAAAQRLLEANAKVLADKVAVAQQKVADSAKRIAAKQTEIADSGVGSEKQYGQLTKLVAAQKTAEAQLTQSLAREEAARTKMAAAADKARQKERADRQRMADDAEKAHQKELADAQKAANAVERLAERAANQRRRLAERNARIERQAEVQREREVQRREEATNRRITRTIRTVLDRKSMQRTDEQHRRFMRKLGIASLITVAVIGATGALGNLSALAASIASIAGIVPIAAAGLAGLTAAAVTMGAVFKGIGSSLSAVQEAKSPETALKKANPAIEAAEFEDAKQRIVDAEEDAADAQKAALKRVEDAQKAHSDAVDNAEKAQKKLNKAVKEARKDLRDLNLEFASAAVKQREAADDLQSAQDAYDLARYNGGLDQASKDRAKTALDAAAIAYEEQTNLLGDLDEKQKEANKNGVMGAESVVEAQQDLVDANAAAKASQDDLRDAYSSYSRTIRDSQRAIQDANKQLFLMELRRADAANTANLALATTFALLPPAAQQAVLALDEVSDMLHAIRIESQQEFFTGFSDSILGMFSTLLPQLKQGTLEIAGSLGRGVQDLFGGLTASLGDGDLGDMMGSWAKALDIANAAIKPFVNAFTDLTVVGSKFLPELATGWTNMANRFDAFITTVRGNGELEAWMRAGVEVAKDLGTVLSGAFGILQALGRAGSEAGGAALGSLGDALVRVADVMNKEPFQSALRVLFEGAFKAFENLGKAFGPLGDMFVKASPSFAKIAELIGGVLANAIGGLADLIATPAFQQGLMALFGGLDKGVAALAGAAPSLGPALGTLGTLLGLMASTIGELLGKILPELGPILGVVLDALMPLVTALGDLVVAVLPVAIPILQGLAGATLGAIGFLTVLVQLITGLFDPQLWINAGGMMTDFWNNTIGMFSDFFTNTVGMFVDWNSNISDGLDQFWSNTGGMFADFFNNTIGMFVDFFNNTVGMFVDFGGHVGKAVEGLVNSIGDWFRSIPDMIRSIFSNADKWLVQPARDMIGGLFSGLQSMTGEIGKFFLNILPGWMVGPFKQALQIKSPSRVFKKLGSYIPAGVVAGVEEGKSKLDATMRALVKVPEVAIPTRRSNDQLDALNGRSGGSGQMFRDVHYHEVVDPNASSTAFVRKLTRSFS